MHPGEDGGGTAPEGPVLVHGVAGGSVTLPDGGVSAGDAAGVPGLGPGGVDETGVVDPVVSAPGAVAASEVPRKTMESLAVFCG